MKRVIMPLAAACVFAAALFAGCSKVSESTSGTATTNDWTIPGVLRIAGRQEPDTLMPVIGTQVVDTDLDMFWAGHLLNWDDQNEYIPELATEVPTVENGGISKDGLTIVYHLRKGVTWHDGAPFTADDVIFSWQQVMNPYNFVPSRQGYDDIAGIDKKDDYTIEVHLKKRYSPFVATFFAISSTTYAVIPKHLLSGLHDLNRTEYANKPVGTGPFMVAEYDKGTLIKFVANPHYWRGPPRLKEIDYRFIGNDNTALTLLKTHEIDMYYRAAQTLAPSLKDIPGTRIVLSPFTRFTDLGFNAGVAALSDVRVRKALAYGTDRAELIAKVTEGVNIPADSDQPPFLWSHDPNVTKYPFDTRRAGELLDAAGWIMGPDGLRHKSGQPLQLTLVGFTGSAVVTSTETVIQRQWRQLGIDVAIKNYPSDILYEAKGSGGIEQNEKFDVAVEQWANGPDPDESILFRCDLAPPHGWNIYAFCSHALDAAERDADLQYDQAARKADYAKVQEILTDQLPILVLWFERDQHVINTDFKNFKPAHAGTPFWNTWEWEI
jgi:peptide/nickel transport system substrate-binding protein